MGEVLTTTFPIAWASSNSPGGIETDFPLAGLQRSAGQRDILRVENLRQIATAASHMRQGAPASS